MFIDKIFDKVFIDKMSTDRPAILILGGSEIAYQIAQELHIISLSRSVRVITSLAGRTQNPRLPAGQWRIGGFGGVDGLVTFLQTQNIKLIIDATHPFAYQIKLNADAAAHISDIPLIRIQRPPWQPQPGDRWIDVADEHQAAAILPKGSRVFLALGRQHLKPFLCRQDVNFIARMLEKPDNLAERDHFKIILGSPGGPDAETNLLRDDKIEMLVCRNSGAHASYAKIVAARNLAIPVIMITQPRPI